MAKKKESYTSIRLVTSNYHMPRSIRLFSYHMPGIHIIPQPVFPDSFKGKNWWLWKGTARLIILEYLKTLLIKIKQLGNNTINYLSGKQSKCIGLDLSYSTLYLLGGLHYY